MGERREAIAVGLGRALTGEVQGEECVVAMHRQEAPEAIPWDRAGGRKGWLAGSVGSAGVVVADAIAAVGAEPERDDVEADEGDHEGDQSGEGVHRDLLLRFS